MKTKYSLPSMSLLSILERLSSPSGACLVTICLLPFFSLSQTASPDVIASAGDHFISTSGSVSWTIGEPVTDTYYGASNILTKGFHQPMSLSLTSVTDMNLEGFIYAYPNPVINDLTIDFSKMVSGKYEIDIYNTTGQIIRHRTIVIDGAQHKETLDVNEFGAGPYFIRITNESSEKYSLFRIIKT